jgi:hypothetical protein
LSLGLVASLYFTYTFFFTNVSIEIQIGDSGSLKNMERVGSGTPDFGLSSTTGVHPNPDLPLSSASSCSDVANAVKKEKKRRSNKERAHSPAGSEASLLGQTQLPQQQQQMLGGSISGMGRSALSMSATSSTLGASVNIPAAMASPQPTSHGADRQKEILRARRRGQTMILPGSARQNNGTADGYMPAFVHERPVDHQPLLRMPSISSLANRHQQVLSPTPRASFPNGSMVLQSSGSAQISVAQQLALSPPVGGAALNSSYKSIVLPRDVQPIAVSTSQQQPSTPDFSEAASPTAARTDVVSPALQVRGTPPAATSGAVEPQQTVISSILCGNEATAVCPARNLRLATDRWPLCLIILSLFLLSISAQRLLSFSERCSAAREALVERPKLDAVVSVMVSMSNYLEYETSSIKSSLAVLSLNDTDPQLALMEPSFVGKSVEIRKQMIRSRIEYAKALELSLTRTNANFVRSALCTNDRPECRAQEQATLRDVRSIALSRFQSAKAILESTLPVSDLSPSLTSSPDWSRTSAGATTPRFDSTLAPPHQGNEPPLSRPTRAPIKPVTATSSTPIFDGIPWAAQRAISGAFMVALVAYILRRGS